MLQYFHLNIKNDNFKMYVFIDELSMIREVSLHLYQRH